MLHDVHKMSQSMTLLGADPDINLKHPPTTAMHDDCPADKQYETAIRQCSGPKRVARLVRKATGVCLICCLNIRSSAATKSPRSSWTDLPIGVRGCSFRLLGLSAILHPSVPPSSVLVVSMQPTCKQHTDLMYSCRQNVRSSW